MLFILRLQPSIIGHPSRKHQDWFDENDEEICFLTKKHRLHKAHQDDTSPVEKKSVYSKFVRQSKTGSVTCKTHDTPEGHEEVHDALKTIFLICFPMKYRDFVSEIKGRITTVQTVVLRPSMFTVC